MTVSACGRFRPTPLALPPVLVYGDDDNMSCQGVKV